MSGVLASGVLVIETKVALAIYEGLQLPAVDTADVTAATATTTDAAVTHFTIRDRGAVIGKVLLYTSAVPAEVLANRRERADIPVGVDL